MNRTFNFVLMNMVAQAKGLSRKDRSLSGDPFAQLLPINELINQNPVSDNKNENGISLDSTLIKDSTEDNPTLLCYFIGIVS